MEVRIPQATHAFPRTHNHTNNSGMSALAYHDQYLMTGEMMIHVNQSPPRGKPSPSNDTDANYNTRNTSERVALNMSNERDGNHTSLSAHHPTNSHHNHTQTSDPKTGYDFTAPQILTSPHLPTSNTHSDEASIGLQTVGGGTSRNFPRSFDENAYNDEFDYPADPVELVDLRGTARKVDEPSAHRLAKRLFNLDGFKKADVAYHLTRDNQFSRKVNEEYLKYFDFGGLNLVEAMRKFFEHFALVGETQERERVLNHFANRYLQCNPDLLNSLYKSQDSCHTLTCAIMLLNTDLHGQNIGKKMTQGDFIENLDGLNGREDFSKDMIKQYYMSIKQRELVWALDDVKDDVSDTSSAFGGPQPNSLSPHSFLNVPSQGDSEEYKRGALQKKHCNGPDLKPIASGKRGWKDHFVVLRGMALFLLKSPKVQLEDKSTRVILLHHSLAQVARSYKRKSFVFSLQTSDWSYYLFSTSNEEELNSWVNTINFVSASLSAEPLAAGVGSQKKFNRPLFPSTHTKNSPVEQCQSHEERLTQLIKSITEEEAYRPDRKSSSKLAITNYDEKMAFLKFERQRYMIYAQLLRDHLGPDMNLEVNGPSLSIGEVDEPETQRSLDNAQPQDKHWRKNTTNRYSYQQAVLNN